MPQTLYQICSWRFVLSPRPVWRWCTNREWCFLTAKAEKFKNIFSSARFSRVFLEHLVWVLKSYYFRNELSSRFPCKSFFRRFFRHPKVTSGQKLKCFTAFGEPGSWDGIQFLILTTSGHFRCPIFFQWALLHSTHWFNKFSNGWYLWLLHDFKGETVFFPQLSFPVENNKNGEISGIFYEFLRKTKN